MVFGFSFRLKAKKTFLSAVAWLTRMRILRGICVYFFNTNWEKITEQLGHMTQKQFIVIYLSQLAVRPEGER
jgi:hypothetical protein